MPEVRIPSRTSVVRLAIGTLAVVAIATGVSWSLLGGGGETTAEDPSSAAATSRPGDPVGLEDEGEAGEGGPDERAEGVGDGDPAGPDTGEVAGLAPEDGRPEDEQAPPADDPATDGAGDGTGSGGTPTTSASAAAPPIAAPTSALPTAAGPLACSLQTIELNGEGGVIARPETGPCRTLDVAIRSLDGGELAPTDWTTDLAICEKHPSAAEVAVSVMTETGAVDVVGSELLSDRGGAEAIDITLPQGYDPANGVQPIVVCRTADTVLSIVHRTTG